MVAERSTPETAAFLSLDGRGVSPGRACGPLARNLPDRPADEVRGAILVARRAVPEDVGRILASSGTLTLGGAFLSHISLLSREFGRPSVSLDSARARVEENPDRGLLRFPDVVGAEGEAVLHEGDVVLLDADHGKVFVPAGFDRELHRRIREIHQGLAAIAGGATAGPLLDEVLALAAHPESPAFVFLLEAALTYRMLPAGAPARALLDAARRRPSHRRVADAWLRRAASEATERLRSAAATTTTTVKGIEELDELDRRVRAYLGEEKRIRSFLRDAGAPMEGLDRLRSRVERAARGRREQLRVRLERRVAEALSLSDAELGRRLGGLFQLVRRARAAHLNPETVSRLRARLARQVAEARARAGARLVVPLSPEVAPDRSLVGGKAAGILEVLPALPAEGCATPRGIVVTTTAYRLHLLGDAGERLGRAVEEEEDEAALSRRARAAILSGEVPEEVAAAVEEALRPMAGTRLALRSSATLEGSHAGSLAGQFDTYLGVEGLGEVLDRLRRAWASLWNARAIHTLRVLGLSPLRVRQAVLIQEMVETTAAGVMLSRDPGGLPDTLLVNAAWGLGEGISQGELPGDLFRVRKSTGELLEHDLGRAAVRIALDPKMTGTVELPLSAEERSRPCLDADQLARLATLARALEESTGRAQDVEFGFDRDGRLVVFQVRRIAPRKRL